MFIEGYNVELQMFYRNTNYAMNGENQLSVIDELIKFETQEVEVRDFRKITDHVFVYFWNT